MNRPEAHLSDPDGFFTTDTTGLPEASPVETIRLHDGDTLDLRIHPVANRIGDDVVRMLAYNGSIPGPTLHVDQGSEITVTVTNDGDTDNTVHWHGLRLENRYDGVPHETQAPIPMGGTFTYKLQFPDAGMYWYHPHMREDFGLEMGLYGTIVVEPADPSFWPPADRHLTITLDDLLMEDGRIAPFRVSGPTHTAMGRFGNVMLVNGRTEFAGGAALGEVVRLYVVNTANTRIFNVALSGARMKLVGGDSGRYERETFVDEVLLAPSERAVLDVLFDQLGEVRLEHRTPDRVYDLGRFTVAGGTTTPAKTSFPELRVDADLSAEREALGAHVEREPDRVLAFVARMPLLYGDRMATATKYVCPMHPEVTDDGPSTCPKCGMKLIPVATEEPVPTTYACPMHPEVTDDEPSTCPKCGMKLVPIVDEPPADTSWVCPMHADVTSDVPGTCPRCGMELVPITVEPPVDTTYACPTHPEYTAAGPGTCPHCAMELVPVVTAAPTTEHHDAGPGHAHDTGDGLEWEDLMPDINRATDSTNMHWHIVDRDTGDQNHAITWAFTVGDRVKIRLVNEMESDHPMHHPFHIHGAGRFLVLARDNRPEPNLVWKDTVLVPAGSTVDILLDVSNPGLWMAHCHIAEHAQNGMMFSFDVRKP
jgi:FtsP/CotA-like multicopper oxidase with cupredoxin domain